MNASRRPPPPDALPPKAVLEGARRALHPLDHREAPIPIPTDPYGEEQVRRAHDILREIEDSVGPSDGERVYRFSKSKRDFLDTLDPARIAALDMLLTERVEHDIVKRSRRRTIKWGVSFLVGAFGVVQWGADALEWTLHKVPLVREIVRVFKGGPPS